jgi:hypothetical protein
MMRLGGLLAAAAVSLALGSGGPVAAQDQSPEAALPDGPGKDVVLRVCTACHGAEQFAYARFSPEGWEVEISKMEGAGAEMTSDEQAAVSAYLSKYLSKPPPPPAPAPAPSPAPEAPPKR